MNLLSLNKTELSYWENQFTENVQQIAILEKKTAGSLLPTIPSLLEWDDFLNTVKKYWAIWKKDLEKFPNCLLLLYSGLAFYEYEGNTFWPQFAKAIGVNTLSTNEQSKINSFFSKVANNIGLDLLYRENGTDFVGSAIYFIGIPLSLWDGFLEICEWTLWKDNWNLLSDNEWADTIEKRVGSRKRLSKFLIENRQSSNEIIQEMHDARGILNKDDTLTINDIEQVCLLRSEYFNEVPETAEFLREKNPDSLFQDRAKLIWDEMRCCISVYLPSLSINNLPAKWIVDNKYQEAASTPDYMVLDSTAFKEHIVLNLESGKQIEKQRIKGVEPWGLFDLENNGRCVNLRREVLPLRNYILISNKKIDLVSRKGFEEEENSINEELMLKDGSICYITNLWPNAKFAELTLKHDDEELHTRFQASFKIEARFFVGRGKHAAYFTRFNDLDYVKIQSPPILHILIPAGYLGENKKEIIKKFKVTLDGKPSGGKWEKQNLNVYDDKEIYSFQWSKQPFRELVTTNNIIKNFKELKNYTKSPDIKGQRTFAIESPTFKHEFKTFVDHSKIGMDKYWIDLPGVFLPWFLLCQSAEGMKWEELIFAKDVIDPNGKLSYYLLRKYANQDLLVQRGRKWTIMESRAVLKEQKKEFFILEYCGDPSVLWGLYRMIYNIKGKKKLPKIEVVNNRGTLPYLKMDWNSNFRLEILRYLKNNNVVIGNTLWIH